jgi:hypothetical protein
MKIDIKTQTRRSTRYHEGYLNVNLFVKNLKIGIITTKDWGDYAEREEPDITIETPKKIIRMSLSTFIQKVEEKSFIL